MQAEVLSRLAGALDAAGIDYMVTGSVASAFHGEPRMTRDIDVVVDPDLAAIRVLVEQFPSDRFFIDDAEMALKRRDMFNVVDTTTGWKVDLMILKDRPFSKTEFGRRFLATISGVELYVASAEDSILSKLEWQQGSGSETQRRDVVQMLVANRATLDEEYLRIWSHELGVEELLAELTDEAERQ